MILAIIGCGKSPYICVVSRSNTLRRVTTIVQL